VTSASLRHLGRLSLVFLASALCVVTAEAQGNRRSVLTVSGFPLTLTGTTVADFDNGFVLVGSTSFTVDLTTNAGAGGFSPRLTTVQVRCGAPCPANFAQVQWRTPVQTVWQSLTNAAFQTVEARVATFNGTNDPWSQTVEWRHLLLWASTPPVVSSQVAIDFQLVVSAP
jgi:hypothetical protein